MSSPFVPESRDIYGGSFKELGDLLRAKPPAEDTCEAFFGALKAFESGRLTLTVGEYRSCILDIKQRDHHSSYTSDSKSAIFQYVWGRSSESVNFELEQLMETQEAHDFPLHGGGELVENLLGDRERWEIKFKSDKHLRIKILTLLRQSRSHASYSDFLEAASTYCKLMKIYCSDVPSQPVVYKPEYQILRSAVNELIELHSRSCELGTLSHGLEEFNPASIATKELELSSNRLAVCLIEILLLISHARRELVHISRQDPWHFVYKYLWSNSTKIFKWEILEAESRNPTTFTPQQKAQIDSLSNVTDCWRTSGDAAQEIRECVMHILGESRLHQRALSAAEVEALLADVRGIEELVRNVAGKRCSGTPSSSRSFPLQSFETTCTYRWSCRNSSSGFPPSPRK